MGVCARCRWFRGRRMDTADLVRSFLLSQWDKAPATRRNYQDAVGALTRFCPGMPMRRIGADHLNGMFAAAAWSQATRVLYWKGLKAFFAWLYRDGIINDDPMAGVAKPKPAQPRRPPRYTDEDLQALLAACRDYM